MYGRLVGVGVAVACHKVLTENQVTPGVVDNRGAIHGDTVKLLADDLADADGVEERVWLGDDESSIERSAARERDQRLAGCYWT